MTKNKKILLSVAVFLLIVLCLGLVLFYAKSNTGGGLLLTKVDKGVCTIRTERAGRKLLEPLYANNSPINFETGEQCNILPRLKRGSVVLYISPRGPAPITLKVAGLPGDKVGTGSGGSLTINGEDYTNSRGATYNVRSSEQRSTMSQIESEHQGVIPKGFYFLMGDNERVYLDSSRFGLSDGKDILGVMVEE